VEAPADAGSREVLVAAPPIDASPDVGAVAGLAGKPVDAGVRKPDRTVAEVDPELAVHLAAAEAARRSGNRLRQLAEADAALAVDGRHVRARFLMGEALLETGDSVNGCRYLRSAKRIREARAILASGRCPAD